MSSCPFVKFKDVLGVPGKGVHKYTFLNTAVVDYLLTILLAVITSYFTEIPLVLTTIFWFIMGIVAHVLFGVNTNTVRFLGLSC
jgi:hypothetical protein